MSFAYLLSFARQVCFALPVWTSQNTSVLQSKFAQGFKPYHPCFWSTHPASREHGAYLTLCRINALYMKFRDSLSYLRTYLIQWLIPKLSELACFGRQKRGD